MRDPQDRPPQDRPPQDRPDREQEHEPELQHQPPSERDLERHPARGADCVRVRALLRAHADAELASAERRFVDEHMHACRDCGVALSRAEAEVHRLRTWLGAAAASPAPDFVRRVMEQVAREATAASARPASGILGGGTVSDEFTPRVMARVRREWRRPRLTRRVAGLLRRQFAVFIAAAAFAVLALSYFATRPVVMLQVQVQSASAATVLRSDEKMVAHEGQRLHTGDVVQTDPAGGHASLRVPRRDVPLADEATVSLDPGASVALVGAPGVAAALSPTPHVVVALRDGAAAVRVLEHNFAMSVDVASTIVMAAGRFRVSVERVVRHDASLALAPILAVRLEVEAGAARILRGSLPAIPVEAGVAALFDGWSPVAFEPLLDEAELVAAAARRHDIAAVRSPAGAVRASDWLGRVINGQTGAGVAGATVRVASRLGEVVTTSAQDGAFWLREQAALEGETAIVRVTLPMGASGHAYAGVAGFVGPVEFLPRGRGPARELLLDPLRLPAERPVMGMVVDPTGRPVSGARVTALLVDQLMGGAHALAPGTVPAALTGGDGRFELRGLPAETAAHTALYLTIEHARFGTVAAADLLAKQSLRDLSIQVTMAGRRMVALSGLPVRATVDVLESIANLPAEAMVLVRHVATDAAGDARLEVAEGASLWLRLDDRIVALLPDAERSERMQPTGEPVIGALAAWVAIRNRTGLTALRGVTRHELPGLASATTQRGLHVFDTSGRELFGARLYLQHANGDGCYLGTLRSAGQLWDLPASGDYLLFAVAEDGAVGVLDATAADGAVLNVRVVPSGAAQLPPTAVGDLGMRPDGTATLCIVELIRLDGSLAGSVVHRHTGAEIGWAIQGLVPGHYQVRLPNGVSGRVVVPSGGVASVVLDPPDITRPPGSGHGR